MAKLPIGEKVFIIESGEIGFIIDYYPDFTVAVDINGELVKVHQTGIIAAKEFGVSNKKESDKKEHDSTENYTAINGVAYLLKAIKNLAGEIVRFDVILLNNSKSDLLFIYTFFLDETLQHKLRKEIKRNQYLLLHEFKTDQLNDNPAAKFEFWEKISEQESENHFTKEIKLRAKQFFAKLEHEEFKKQNYLVFEVLKEIPGKKVIIHADDWDEEEINNAYYKKKLVHNKKYKEHDVVQKANLPDFIDLHIEKLEKQYQQLSAADIMQIQLRHCRNFIDKAIMFRLDKIYLIHGLGKGVLKQEIEKLLDTYTEISSYNNNYHPRFGYGATEVIL